MLLRDDDLGLLHLHASATKDEVLILVGHAENNDEILKKFRGSEAPARHGFRSGYRIEVLSGPLGNL